MDADVLAAIRADAIDELQTNGDGTTATVYSPDRTQTALGGVTSNYAPGAVYPCILQAGVRIPKEMNTGEEITSIADYTAKLPWNAVVSVTDRLQVGSNMYEVLAQNGDQSERITLEVNLKVPNG